MLKLPRIRTREAAHVWHIVVGCKLSLHTRSCVQARFALNVTEIQQTCVSGCKKAARISLGKNMFRSQSQAFHTFQRFLFANKLLNESVFAEATCAAAQLLGQILIVPALSQLQDQFVSFCSSTCFLRFDQTVSRWPAERFPAYHKKVIPSRSEENQMNILDLWPGNSWDLHTFDLFGNKILLKVWNVPDGSRLHHKIM